MPGASTPLDLEALLRESEWLRRLAGALVRDPEAAEDLVQEAWVAALERPPRIGGRRSGLRAWLRTVLRHRARDEQRKALGRAWHEQQAAREPAPSDGSTLAERLELQQRIATAVLHLDEPYRSAVALRYLDGLSTRELAQREGVSLDAARQRVSRGLAALRARLDRDVPGGRSAWAAIACSLAGRDSATAIASLFALGGIAEGAKLAALAVAISTAVLVAWWVNRSSNGEQSELANALQPSSIEAVEPVERPSTARFAILDAPEVDSRRAQEMIAPQADIDPTDPAPGVGGLASIAGRVLVSGAVPNRRVKLRLFADRPKDVDVEAYVEPGPWIETDEAGRFVFEGLPVGWSGRIGNSSRYRPSPLTRATAPRSDLVLDLVPQRGFSGRLVDASTRSPVEGAVVESMVNRPDGSSLGLAGELDTGGAFFIAWDESELDSVHLDARAAGGLRGSFDFDLTQIPEDLDMGELVLMPGRTVRVHVADLQGAAIQGARLRVRDGGAVLVALTDSAGAARLEGLPMAGCTIQVLAPGFEVERVPAPASIDSLEVALSPANRLEVLVTDPAGAPQPGVRVRIAAAGRDLFSHGGNHLDAFLSPQRARRGMVGGSTPAGVSALFTTDRQGRVKIQSVRPGLALELSVEDQLGTVAHREALVPFSPIEHRVHHVLLATAPCSLEGQVVDPAGNALSDASLVLRNDSVGIGESTGADGRFRLWRFFEGTARLEVRRRGFVSRQLPVTLSSEAPPLRIALDPGRSVNVLVVDAHGKAIQAGSLGAGRPGRGQTWDAVPGEGGLRQLQDLPLEDLELRLVLAGKEYRRSLAAFQDEVELRVPVHGGLEVARPLTEEVGVRLASLDDETVVLWRWPGSKPEGLAVFENVLPGRYSVSLVTEGEVEIGAAELVEVQAGSVTRTEPRLPQQH